MPWKINPITGQLDYYEVGKIEAHTLDSHSEKKLDALDEKTPNAGVTVDSCLIQDGKVADSEKLEGSTKAEVQDHTPKAHALDSHSEKKIDVLDEKTLNAGVTVDSCLIQDGKVADSNLLEGSTKAEIQDHAPQAHALDSHSEKKLDTLDEKTLNAGVTIDSCLIQDGKVADSNLLEGLTKVEVQDHPPQAHTLDFHSEKKLDALDEKTPNAGVTVDGCLIQDGMVADSNKLEGNTKEEVRAGLVPYTEADNDVDLGSHTLKATELEITDSTKGVILNSANKKWRLTVDDDGVLITQEIQEEE